MTCFLDEKGNILKEMPKAARKQGKFPYTNN